MGPETASLFVGIASFVSAWAVLSVMGAKRKTYDDSHQFERKRREAIRKGDFTYRNFEPAIDELALSFVNIVSKEKIEKVEEDLATSGIAEPWKTTEFMAAKTIESFAMAIGAFLFLILILNYDLLFSLVLSVMTGFGMFWLFLSGVDRKSKKRRRRIKRDFAAAIDLLALMMGVGGGFIDSLKVVALEFRGKDLGIELDTIIGDVGLGKPRKQALGSFEKRMKDEDISEVVFACNESEELGVPLAKTLQDQADRIRQKRSSWAEIAAKEAEVTLTFPAMIIMIACILTVGAPFALSFFKNASFL